MRRCLAILLMGAAGCQQPLQPVFENIWPAVEWPASPDVPRIRYLGALSGEDSLKKPKPFSLKALLAGPEPTVGFSTPTAVAARGQRVFVADGQSRVVYSLDLQTRDFRAIGAGGAQPLQWPADLMFVGENLAVADSRLAVVLFFTMDGQFIKSIGDGVLQRPVALAYRDATRELWVLDAAQHALIAFDEQGREVRRVGQRGDETGAFNFPAGLACNERLGLVVADSMNFRVQILDGEGRPKGAFGRKGDAAGDFSLPRDVAIDSEGHLYVLDNQFENIQIFDEAGRLLMAWGEEGRGPGQFYLPGGMFIDEQDRIWVADTYNRRVQVFQYLREAPEAAP
ncbi:MAG TPA: 6-bladed beta-propeller [Phycisphaerae bacterium]|nr:6-bladed beta-propeller [Phycisphaerae bacterium]